MNLATFSGMMWYVIPMSVITINDIAAYMVGFFVGKTPLIKVSQNVIYIDLLFSKTQYARIAYSG